MIKDILFDADGVAVKNRGKYFSEKYSEDYGVPGELVAEFFKNEYGRCARGEADLKEVLVPYLGKWGWSEGVEKFTTYWFESERELEDRLLEFVDRLRQQGIRCSIVSDQEKYRAKYLMTQTDLGRHFDRAFFSMDLGCKKSEEKFFQSVMESLQVRPEMVMYWDDDPKNVNVARQIGIDGRTYVGFEDFEEQMKAL